MQQPAAPPPAQQPPAPAGNAPPKQVAQALEQLGQAGRLIADVRLGADRLLEALFFVAEKPHHQYSAKCLNLILKEESLMRQYLVNLRAIGQYTHKNVYMHPWFHSYKFAEFFLNLLLVVCNWNWLLTFTQLGRKLELRCDFGHFGVIVVISPASIRNGNDIYAQMANW